MLWHNTKCYNWTGRSSVEYEERKIREDDTEDEMVEIISLPFFPLVRGEVLPATSSAPHLRVFPLSSVSCLVLPVFLLSCFSRIYLNTISALSSLVSSCDTVWSQKTVLDERRLFECT